MPGKGDKVADLAQIEQLEEKLEQSNKEKQEWKQCAHTLADALEMLEQDIDPKGIRKEEIAGVWKRQVGSKTMPTDESVLKMIDALEQFNKLQS